MIPKECKRLAEVDFPIAAVSAHSAREKSIRHGHPSTLHLWWARRPLAACRAMLMALLLPDPADANCPADFKTRSKSILNDFPEYKAPTYQKMLGTDDGLRHLLLHKFIADFANWDNASNPAYLKTARALVKAAHGEEAPLVVDPFAGGGSIPLEALRMGCDAFASDLNPVACLINKVLIEDIPRHGRKLADDLKRMSEEIKKQAKTKLEKFYPADPPDSDGVVARPITYIWARTVRCEQPNCGCEIPLVRSFWLCKKPTRRLALRWSIERKSRATPILELEMFRPENEGQLQPGTVSNSKATCPACQKVLSGDRVRAQLTEQSGGSDPVLNPSGKRTGGARLLAVVLLRPGEPGRHYRLPTTRDYGCVFAARKHADQIGAADHGERTLDAALNPVRPSPNARGFSAVTRYGMSSVDRLFTGRQLMALNTITKLVDASEGPARTLMAFAVSKLADLACALCRWEPIAECPRQLFTRHAAAITWDFAEGVPISDASGGISVCVENVLGGLSSLESFSRTGTVSLANASDTGLPSDGADVWFTDPPYYDAIPYADLSDFFFTWLKRCLPDLSMLKDPFDSQNRGTPKLQECVWNQAYKVDGRNKDGAFFESTIAKCFSEARRFLGPAGIGSVVFAHSTTEGWEALLSGLINAGWTVTGSWPIATEMGSRIRARNTAALATSVHLVCRPRDEFAAVGDWGEIVRDLPKRILDWMERLSAEGIRGADLVFACIGPALELFSKHARVETPDGEVVGLAANEKARGEPGKRGFLSYIWEVAGRTALNQVLGSAESKAKNGAAGALEEDARLTALFLWTLQATEAKATSGADEDDDQVDDVDDDAEDEDGGGTSGKKKKGLTLIYDVARRFAQPLGIHLDIWEGRIIETAKGIVRLLPVGERATQLFGEEGASAVVRRFEAERKPNPQFMLEFMAEQRAAVPEIKTRGRRKKAGDAAAAEGLRTRKEATTLDRVHAAMLLQASGASNALRALLQAEMQRGPDFLRLANALSALYPRDSEEKRLLDAMLLAVRR